MVGHSLETVSHWPVADVTAAGKYLRARIAQDEFAAVLSAEELAEHVRPSCMEAEGRRLPAQRQLTLRTRFMNAAAASRWPSWGWQFENTASAAVRSAWSAGNALVTGLLAEAPVQRTRPQQQRSKRLVAVLVSTENGF